MSLHSPQKYDSNGCTASCCMDTLKFIGLKLSCCVRVTSLQEPPTSTGGTEFLLRKGPQGATVCADG